MARPASTCQTPGDADPTASRREPGEQHEQSVGREEQADVGADGVCPLGQVGSDHAPMDSEQEHDRERCQPRSADRRSRTSAAPVPRSPRSADGNGRIGRMQGDDKREQDNEAGPATHTPSRPAAIQNHDRERRQDDERSGCATPRPWPAPRRVARPGRGAGWRQEPTGNVRPKPMPCSSRAQMKGTLEVAGSSSGMSSTSADAEVGKAADDEQPHARRIGRPGRRPPARLGSGPAAPVPTIAPISASGRPARARAPAESPL